MSETLSEGISTLILRISPQGCRDLTPPTCHVFGVVVSCAMWGGQSVKSVDQSRGAQPTPETVNLLTTMSIKKTHHGDGLEEELERVFGMLARQEQQALVPDRLQGLHLLPAMR